MGKGMGFVFVLGRRVCGWWWGVAVVIPTFLSTFVQMGLVGAVNVFICVCVCVCESECVLLVCEKLVSVAVVLVGVLGWLLGGRGVSHAALGQ